MSSKLNKRTLVILLIVGSMFTLIGAYFTLDQVAFSGRSLTTTAVVIDNNPVDFRRGTDYFPVFQFINDKTGENVTAVGIVGHGPDPAYSVGQSVQILYDPENPTVGVRANTFLEIGFVIVTSLIIGIGMITIAVIKIRRVRRTWSSTIA